MTPVEALTSTLLSYLLALGLYRLSGGRPLFQPVVTGILIMIGYLLWRDVDYSTYFSQAQAIHTLLGTATVALAIPLYESRHRIRQFARPIVIAVITGGTVAAASSVMLARWLGLPDELVITVAPKSVTTPIALALSDALGGLPALSGAIVIITGMLVALAGPLVERQVSHLSLGLAMGLSGHGIATARAFGVHGEAGAFSALAMGLTGIYTSFLLPVLLPLFGLY